jgi:hypothetical protein
LAPGFFHESTPYGHLIHTLKHFRILIRILGDIRIPKLFCGVSDPAEQILRGIKPRETTFKNEYFSEFEKKFKNILGCEFGDYMESIRGKNQRSKISCYCPFNFFSLDITWVVVFVAVCFVAVRTGSWLYQYIYVQQNSRSSAMSGHITYNSCLLAVFRLTPKNIKIIFEGKAPCCRRRIRMTSKYLILGEPDQWSETGGDPDIQHEFSVHFFGDLL